jgi:uncharacterized protein (TIGR00255 family)
MIRSMTGFARVERATNFGTLAWELRSVNHRYLEVSLRVPDDFRSLEAEFRAVIAAGARRGKLDVVLSFRPHAGTLAPLELDEQLLEQLLVGAAQVAARATARLGALTLTAPTALDLLRWPGVLRDPERDRGALLGAAQETLRAALAALADSRASEGARIREMLESRCRQLEELVAAIAVRLPELRARIRARLEERLAALVLEFNRERLEQELALVLTRMDIDEELDRLGSHVAEARKVLAADEPAGRRLDFLMQEFNREANTLSSKSQDVDTTRAAVDIKVLIEQMREQVQNVE